MESKDQYKRKIMQHKNLTKKKLEELIQKKRDLPGISGENMALIAVAQDLGIKNRELLDQMMEELILPDSLKKIEGLKKGMRCASLVARIVRILPKRESKGRHYQNILLRDETGEILCTFFGEEVEKLKKKGKDLEVGDPILVKCVNVREFGGGLSLSAIKETKVRKIDSKKKFTESLPPLEDTLHSIKEIIEIGKALTPSDTKELNCEGILVWKGNIKEFDRRDGSTGKVMNFRITELKNDHSIRGVAWGKSVNLVKNLELGDILTIRGGKVKISNYQLKKGAKKKDAIEIHIGNLTSIEQKGGKNLKLKQARTGMRGKLFYVYVLESPQERVYQKKGEEKRMVFLKVSDTTQVARLVIWAQNLIEEVKHLERGNQLKVFGNVNKGEFFDKEIHVSSTGNVKIDPPDFPEEIKWENIKREEQQGVKTQKSVKSKSKEHIGLVSDFSDLAWNVKCDLKGFVEYKQIEKSGEKRESLLILGDGKERVEVHIQNQKIIDKLQEIPETSKIRLNNVIVPPKGGKYDLEDVLVGKECSIEYFGKDKVKEKNEGKKQSAHSSPLLLKEVQSEGMEKVLVTVTGIKEVGIKDYCKVCGGSIISQRGKNKICEKGHESEGRSILSLVLEIEDGEEKGSAVIKGSKIQELDLSRKNKSEILSKKEEFMKEISKKMIGKDIYITGNIRFEEGETRVYLDDFKQVAPNKMTKRILEKISDLSSS